MKRLHTLFLLLALGLCASLQAQEAWRDTVTNMVERVDQRLYKRQHRVSIDTNYIQVPEYRWTLKSTANVGWNSFGVGQIRQRRAGLLLLGSTPSFSQGFSVSWRNITIGMAISPFQLWSKTRTPDQSYSISMYGNRMGMSAAVRYSETLQGVAAAFPDSVLAWIPIGSCRDLSADFDAWYALNGKEFSFPAAFSQSQIQTRSAGSPLFSIAIRNGVTYLDSIEKLGNQPITLWTNMLSLGAGYGHNFVTRHHWLIHFSTVTNLTVLKYNRVDMEEIKSIQRGTFPDFVGTLQLSALHWTGRFFYGFNGTLRGALYGRIDKGLYNNNRGDLQFLFGIRL